MNRCFTARASLLALLVLAASCDSAPDKNAAAIQNYVDRQAIETTLVRYSTGLDTFDAGIYASAFATDAEFTIEGKVYSGRDQIGSIITGMKASRAARTADADPANDPAPIMHHVMSNAVIEVVGPDRALHHCYWMTVSGGPALNSFKVAAVGRYEDELVKRNGEWLIYRRKIVE